MGDAVRGEDGRWRCPWASGPQYLTYHDGEWGRPVREESALLERITLEAFQSGLSWLTILRKRPAFRAAFADFDPATVAAFTDADRDRLMADGAIVRNRRKVDAAIANAQATVALRQDGGLVEYFWSFQPAQVSRPRSLAEVPASTPESVALAKGLRAKGFEHIGPTTMYAAMQACGVVTDHLVDCEFGGPA
ncbi:DNA-3-methyladenine glycosylase I [Branchiibius cervicis]|uniref:DNA-3-methyladenine glycosylase I n=1 Tax=Branchiibius cervicis TaxID=908252 RepID=A0ABW2APN6_9MICO